MEADIIALLGSPYSQGNTERLLERAIAGATDAGAKVEKVVVPDLDFEPCMEILNCVHAPACMMIDDLTPFYDRFQEIDGLIVATPVMTMGVPGKLKSFMDRFQVFYNAKYLRNDPLVTREQRKWRRALLLSIGGADIPHDFDGVRYTMGAFCDITDFDLFGEVIQGDMDTLRDVTKKPELMQEAYDKAKAMVSEILSLKKSE